MKQRNGFFLYFDQYGPISNLTDAQLGKLLRAMFLWNDGQQVEFDDPMAEFAFGFFKASFEREKQKYAEICEQKRAAARSRWDAQDARASESMQPDSEDADASSAMQNMPNINLELESNLELEKKEKRGGKPAPPSCPQLKIVDLYHDELPSLPHMKIWEGDKTREGNLRARWRERWEKQKYSTTEEGLAYWQRLFRHVRDCPWLMGEITPRDGKPPFRADLAWLVKPENFAKLIEGKYDRRPE